MDPIYLQSGILYDGTTGAVLDPATGAPVTDATGAAVILPPDALASLNTGQGIPADYTPPFEAFTDAGAAAAAGVASPADVGAPVTTAAAPGVGFLGALDALTPIEWIGVVAGLALALGAFGRSP